MGVSEETLKACSGGYIQFRLYKTSTEYQEFNLKIKGYIEDTTG